MPNRFLQTNNHHYGGTNINNEQKTEEEKRRARLDEDPGTFFLGWFFIYFFMGLYIICILKKIPQVADKTDYVWKFMFFANNGILVASFFNFLSFKNILMDSSPFALSLIGFVIGCVYYIWKFTKNCNANYANEYFKYEKLNEIFIIPFFIWNLVGLTDPCCREDNYEKISYHFLYNFLLYLCFILFGFLVCR
jgi:predicted membrane channel-forming protein YqfA (hemolysin III family)